MGRRSVREVPMRIAILLQRRSVPLMTVATVVALAGCASTAASPSAGGGGGGGGSDATTVDVTLQEWSVNPSVTSAPAGDVTFAVTNDGPEDVHEFVVLATDLSPDALPTDEHGAVTEEGEGMEVVDEIEDIPVGETQELTVTLEPGNYVLLCNIYSEDEDEAHYQMGMRIAFEATE
jgi:uncharacterized cupredoxin-like copper-binding protein